MLREVLEEPEIDVVCTPLNMAGHYMEDGGLEERIEIIQELKDDGKGIYVIKILSAGMLRDNAESAITYALQFDELVDAWNIGMYSVEEVKANIKLFKEVLG